MKKNKQPKTLSKVALMLVLIFCMSFEVAILVAWMLFDRSGAAEFAGVIAVPMATALGFYSWKAKAENMIKLQRQGLNQIIGITNEEPQDVGGK